MKIYLIAALFLAALVVAHAEDEKIELPKELDQPEQPEKDSADGGDGTEGDSNEDSADGGDGTEGDSNEVEASEDESVDKRRLRNILSTRSCLLLKRGGYCRRYPFIRRLCLRTCHPVVCRDKLSSLSCRRIRFPYRRCRTPFGRYFCAHTCGNCGVPPGCRNYAVLNQLNRRKSRPRGNVLLCDQRGFARRWYRFTGLAGNRMPTRAPPKNRCGTHAPGWMVGSYPRIRGQVVRRKVCYHWGNNRCSWHNYIKVKNCGRYYLFYLSPTPACHLRYCGNA